MHRVAIAMSPGWFAAAAAAVAVALTLACGPAAQEAQAPEPSPRAMATTTPPAPLVSASVAPADHPPLPSPLESLEMKLRADLTAGPPACNGPTIDLRETFAEKKCKVWTGVPETARVDVAGRLDVHVALDPPETTPGGRIAVTVRYTNIGTDLLFLDFTRSQIAHRDGSTGYLRMTLIDSKGRELSEPEPEAGLKAMPALNESTAGSGAPAVAARRPEPSSPPRYRIVLKPQASASLSDTFVAEGYTLKGPPKKKAARDRVSPLPPDTYKLHVLTPLVGVNESERREYSRPAIDLRVTKK